MKKISKRTTIVLSITISILFIIAASAIYKLKSATSNMSVLPTGHIADDVFAIKDKYVNLYIIQDKDTCIAVDAGNDIETVKQEIAKLKIDIDKISAVFLTHTDKDHVAALQLFKNAKIYIGAPEEKLLNGEVRRSLIFKNKIQGTYEKLSNNQEININTINVKCILTPGHTPGSMCYIVNDKYLFTGDTISIINGKAGLFVDLFNMDSRTEADSIKKINNLKDIKYIFTAHFGLSNNYTNAFESRVTQKADTTAKP